MGDQASPADILDDSLNPVASTVAVAFINGPEVGTLLEVPAINGRPDRLAITMTRQDPIPLSRMEAASMYAPLFQQTIYSLYRLNGGQWIAVTR